jgi:pepsin A
MVFLSISSSLLAILAALSFGVNAAIPPRSYHVELTRKLIGRRDGSAEQAIPSTEGFWFGDFTIGGSSNLSMLIDTGFADVIVNPGHYKAGNYSKSFNEAFSNSYWTTSSDGTGTGTVWRHYGPSRYIGTNCG